MPLQIFEQRYLDLVRDSMKNAEPFGVVWIRSGSEVAQVERTGPDLGDYGTCARIVDWDQLPNGLLGITIEGAERFDLFTSYPMDCWASLSRVPSASTCLKPVCGITAWWWGRWH
jgi:Lon protease-like protein